MKIIHEIKGMSGESEGRGTKEEENKGRYNDNKKLSAAIRREIQTAKHPSLYIYTSLSKASSIFLFKRAFEFRAMIEQRLNRFLQSPSILRWEGRTSQAIKNYGIME